MTSTAAKRSVRGVMSKLLQETRSERGMTLLPFASRCIRAGEIHELVSTDQRELAAGSRVDNVGFIGFVEFTDGGVVDVGDLLAIGVMTIGAVVGFDDCHYPNHYNIIVHSPTLVTGADVALEDPVAFHSPDGQANGD